MRFLVTGANGDIGEAIGRILRERWPDASLHGADMVDTWPALSVFDGMYRLPPGAEAAYTDALASLARAVSADIVIPVTEPELLRLSTSPGAAVDLPLVKPSASLVCTFLDKLDTHGWLSAHGLPSPHTIELKNAAADDLPLMVKARRGSGSRGYEVVRSPGRLDLAKSEKSDGFLAQALLEPDDEEYTCALVRLRGALRTLVMRRRLTGGLTMRIEVVRRPDIEVLLSRIADASMLEGSINVQLRVTRSGPFIFEINPRFSGTVMMRHRLGFQDVVWAIEALLSGAIPPAYEAPIGARVFRLARELVVPPSAA